MTEPRHTRDMIRFNRKRYIMKRMRRFRDKLGQIHGMNYFNKNKAVYEPIDYMKKEEKWYSKPRIKKIKNWDEDY